MPLNRNNTSCPSWILWISFIENHWQYITLSSPFFQLYRFQIERLSEVRQNLYDSLHISTIYYLSESWKNFQSSLKVPTFPFFLSQEMFQSFPVISYGSVFGHQIASVISWCFSKRIVDSGLGFDFVGWNGPGFQEEDSGILFFHFSQV